MSSSNSPCAACKCRRQKCTQECVFAPYFPPDQPQKFINVHKVFGASNVAKLLNDLNASQREDAVNSLAYEADYRLRDPVYGCVGLISLLQQKLRQVQSDLYVAKKELASYVGPSALFPIMQPNFLTQQQHPNIPSPSTMLPYTMQPMMSMQPGMTAAHGGQVIIRDPQQQQMLEAQQMAAAAAAREQQEMLRIYEQNQQPQAQQEVMRFNCGFDTAGAAGTATANFNQMPVAGAGMCSSPVVFGSYENFTYHQMQHQQLPSDTSHSHSQAHQLQFQSQIMLQQQPQQNYPPQAHESQQPQATLQQPQRAKSEEGRSIGPSC